MHDQPTHYVTPVGFLTRLDRLDTIIADAQLAKAELRRVTPTAGSTEMPTAIDGLIGQIGTAFDQLIDHLARIQTPQE